MLILEILAASAEVLSPNRAYTFPALAYLIVPLLASGHLRWFIPAQSLARLHINASVRTQPCVWTWPKDFAVGFSQLGNLLSAKGTTRRSRVDIAPTATKNKQKTKKREPFLPLDTAFRTFFLANFSVNNIGKGKDEGGEDTERTAWMSKEGERSDKRNIERLLS